MAGSLQALDVRPRSLLVYYHKPHFEIHTARHFDTSMFVLLCQFLVNSEQPDAEAIGARFSTTTRRAEQQVNL
ncbi:hypothetical protein BsWGS_18889 [Bradybaena similaris]